MVKQAIFNISKLIIILVLLFATGIAEAKSKKNTKSKSHPKSSQSAKAVKSAKKVVKNSAPKHKKVAKQKTVVKNTAARQNLRPRNISSIASVEANRSLEIRGQARNLSMMLVLKNSKDNIDFVKVRNDYTSEINGTQF
ncbi:MAG: hypothetical protein A2Z20_00230 [Bdellovibrionales bacterium RBG_16_40_8]|nr:MAG: hypothetical protein A2Z20_00230 [Bdellovibrionales bacterium RBG_16_40_8]